MNAISEHEISNLLSNQRSLHIEVVTETYPPEVNGVAHTVSMLVQGLKRELHSVCVIRPRQASDLVCNYPKNTDPEQSVLSDLVSSLPIPFYRELRMGMPAKRHLIKRWTKQRPDIVHIATEGPLGWSAVRAARTLGIPTTSDFRTNFHAYSTLYKLGFLEPIIMSYMRHMHNATDRTMVPSTKLSQELKSRGFSHISVIPRGIDTEHFSNKYRSPDLRASWGVTPTDVVLLSVGRLAVEKNLELLIRSYDALRAVEPTTKLVIVGDGPLRALLSKQCPTAIFAGTLRGTALSEHYASADIFIFPSLTETFGNVTIEAMASGLAVVAYQHAAAGDLIESGHNGITVPPNDENSFIQAVLDLSMNRSLSQKISKAAVDTAKKHAWESIVQRTVTVFQDVIQTRQNTFACHDKFISST